MAHEIIKIDGDVITVHIRSVMRFADQKALQDVAIDFIRRGLYPRVLVIAEDFEGWEKSEEWGNDDFLLEFGNQIVKIAIVTDERWKDPVLMFTGKGLRSTEIECFDPSSLDAAKQWLRA
ncbi:MAG: STAS/SEC14 domain-containing protein [Methylicorpusculum sp.]|uniref:STAS/SEC14 domain-containing protein n=1 Tax=Methylicorpusculum sp. TaxID=2713644 RepID=UPI002731E661|nr:STAS/SEC14 domain-containing protein [Methylicorpusculum sp.]MDP2203296.1 STAS/SEC14 domain-containing protein [Methylicorpusculum sp.]